MIIEIRNHPMLFRPFEINDIDNLTEYLNYLSPESKKRFSPHPFTKEAIAELFYNASKYKLFIAIDLENTYIAAYLIVKIGWLDFEQPRLSSYKLKHNAVNCCTIAPSVADSWQDKGLGSNMFYYLKSELYSACKITRFFLWGGVKCSNIKAVNFYKKHGFRTIGEFEHEGHNYDMMLDLGLV